MDRQAPDQPAPALDAPLMTVHGVGKKYSRDLKRSLWYGLKDMARELLLRKEQTGKGWTRSGEFWAVRGISFELKRGEALALIGPNGAGKSTLLKMLSGLIKPDTGHIRVSGRTGALIELGAGFDPLLSGRENINVSAAVLGLSRAEINEVLPKIIAFSELEDYIDSPVKYYSSGMQARLSFAVASHLYPTVFLVDEVLAVGDIDFQRKCINHMLRYLAGGGALILVSHSPYLIQSVCNRGIFLHEGRVQFVGSAIDALNYYLRNPVMKAAGTATETPRIQREVSDAKPVAIDELVIEGVAGEILNTGEEARVTVKFRVGKEVTVFWGFTIMSNDQWVCITGSADFTPRKLGRGEHSLSCLIPKLPLLPGQYLLKVGLLEAESRQPLALLGWEDAPVPFKVQAPGTFLNNAFQAINQIVTVDVVWEEVQTARLMPLPTSKHQGEAPHTLADVVDHFEKNAVAYQETFGEILQACRPHDVNELLSHEMRSMQLADGQHVLDAGCGVCGPSIWFAKHKSVTIEGVTITPSQLGAAQKAVAQAGLADRIHIHVGDFHHLEDIFPPDSFDTVFFLEALCHAVSYKRTLASVRKVLKPGGCLYIKDYFERDFSGDPALKKRAHEFLRKCYKEYSLTTILRREMTEMLGELGFEIELFEPIPFVGEKEDLSLFVAFEEKAGFKWREGLDFWLPENLELRARKR